MRRGRVHAVQLVRRRRRTGPGVDRQALVAQRWPMRSNVRLRPSEPAPYDWSRPRGP